MKRIKENKRGQDARDTIKVAVLMGGISRESRRRREISKKQISNIKENQRTDEDV
jgi:hypothetical protein